MQCFGVVSVVCGAFWAGNHFHPPLIAFTMGKWQGGKACCLLLGCAYRHLAANFLLSAHLSLFRQMNWITALLSRATLRDEWGKIEIYGGNCANSRVALRGHQNGWQHAIGIGGTPGDPLPESMATRSTEGSSWRRKGSGYGAIGCKVRNDDWMRGFGLAVVVMHRRRGMAQTLPYSILSSYQIWAWKIESKRLIIAPSLMKINIPYRWIIG